MPLFTLRIQLEHNPALQQRVDACYMLLQSVLINQRQIMATLDEVLAVVEAESGEIDSMTALLQQLEEQVKGVTIGTLPPDVQAKVDAIFAKAKANSDKIVNAVKANPDTSAKQSTNQTPGPAPLSAGSTAPDVSSPSAAPGTISPTPVTPAPGPIPPGT